MSVDTVEPAGPPPMTTTSTIGGPSVRANAVEISVAAQVDFVVHERGRCVKPIVEVVAREHLEFRSVANDQRRAVAVGDVHASCGADRRRKHFAEVRQTLELIM